MGIRMRICEDALACRIRKARRRRIRRTIGWSVTSIVIFTVLVFTFVIGIASYKESPQFYNIPADSKIVYLKLSKQYDSNDYLIVKGQDSTFINTARDYEKYWKHDKQVRTKVLGKVLCYYTSGGLHWQ